MALLKKALQLKREKKKKKRQVKSSKILLPTINCSNWPIHECLVPEELWEVGISQVMVSRKNSEDDIAVGMYLIDIFCLGIKDCFVRLTDLYEYQDMLDHVKESCGELERVEPVYINTLIHKAAEYAMQHGFKPHHDFAKAKKLLRNIPIDDNQEFIFGIDGKPYYTPGPYESRSEINRILNTLELNKGTDNHVHLVEILEDNEN